MYKLEHYDYSSVSKRLWNPSVLKTGATSKPGQLPVAEKLWIKLLGPAIRQGLRNHGGQEGTVVITG